MCTAASSASGIAKHSSTTRASPPVRPGAEAEFVSLRETHGVPGATIGGVGGDDLSVEGWFAIPLAELAAAHAGVLPGLFG